MSSFSQTLRTSLEAQKELPLRLVVRVVIFRGDKVCLCRKMQDGKLVALNFPGGGVETGTDMNAMVHAVEMEALEEVGIKVKNIQALGINYPAKHPMGAKREHLFSGTDNHYFRADYDGEDHRLLNKEGDAMSYDWVAVKEAIRRIKSGPESQFNEIRLRALNAVL